MTDKSWISSQGPFPPRRPPAASGESGGAPPRTHATDREHRAVLLLSRALEPAGARPQRGGGERPVCPSRAPSPAPSLLTGRFLPRRSRAACGASGPGPHLQKARPASLWPAREASWSLPGKTAAQNRGKPCERTSFSGPRDVAPRPADGPKRWPRGRRAAAGVSGQSVQASPTPGADRDPFGGSHGDGVIPAALDAPYTSLSSPPALKLNSDV